MKRVLALILLSFLLGALYLSVRYNLYTYLDLHSTQLLLDPFKEVYSEEPLKFVLYYSLVFLLITMTMVPITIVLILVGGGIMSPLYAALIATLCVSFGNCVTFVCIRYFFYNWIITHCHKKIAYVNRHLKEDGIFYVIFIRFIPGLPLFLINILLAVTELKSIHFLFGTLLGSFFPFYVLSKMGQTLSSISSFHDLYTFETIFTFILFLILAACPIIYKNYKRIRFS